MNSASTSLPCLLLMLGGAGARGAQPPLHWEPKEGAQSLDSRHTGARAMQMTPLCTDPGRERGKNSEQKERERAVCRLPRGLDAQPLRDLHIPKTQRCSYSPDASAHITAGEESKPCCVQELYNVDAITPP